MSTVGKYRREDINKSNKFFSEVRTIIETSFYTNSVMKIETLSEAYKIAISAPTTIVSDMEIFRPESLGLPENAKVILSNDGSVHGRCANARRIYHSEMEDAGYFQDILKEASYKLQTMNTLSAECLIGLDESFMVKARLLIPSKFSATLYNWLLNFQEMSSEYLKKYNQSRKLDESDILIMSDPDWSHPEFPYGLSLFDIENNCVAILGMKYFGEFKKGTLTMAWSIANRNGYASCHGGLKRYALKESSREDQTHVMGIFGLSGSGKSTLTHAKHDHKYDVTVLHDDAFIISVEEGKSVALEPSYFDKTADYPLVSEENKYLLSVQNCGMTMDASGKKVIVCEDIRNSNGRAIKSILWSENRVNVVHEKINSIVWLMKDETLPPVLKINDPILASTMGALLATKRTSAERSIKGIDRNKLVIEPYANPFRTHNLVEDYEKFKVLFAEKNVDCYIFNTGFFMGNKVTKEMTIDAIERIVENKVEFVPWQNLKNIEYMDHDGFNPDMNDNVYIQKLKEAFEYRLEYLESNNNNKKSINVLPSEVNMLIKEYVDTLSNLCDCEDTDNS